MDNTIAIITISAGGQMNWRKPCPLCKAYAKKRNMNIPEKWIMVTLKKDGTYYHRSPNGRALHGIAKKHKAAEKAQEVYPPTTK